MKTIMVGLLVASLGPGIAFAAGAPPMPIIAQAKTDQEATPKRIDARVLTVRGTVEAIDKDKQTVTLKGPNRSLTVRVKDPSKLDAIKVGDPVVGKYYESLMIEVKKPGETPAGAVAQQITVTATIVAIDKKAQTATIKGPEGNTVTVKARDPKNLDKVKVGDNVGITYTEALAISLDKTAKK